MQVITMLKKIMLLFLIYLFQKIHQIDEKRLQIMAQDINHLKYFEML